MDDQIVLRGEFRLGIRFQALVLALCLLAWVHAEAPRTIVFVCEHGAAKSVIAAAYFNKLAIERHLPFRAIARGVAPQPEASATTVAGLRQDGVPFPNEPPRSLTEADVRDAARIVAFCPLPSFAKRAPVETQDVPAPGDGYAAARDAILVHVKELIEELAGPGR